MRPEVLPRSTARQNRERVMAAIQRGCGIGR